MEKLLKINLVPESMETGRGFRVNRSPQMKEKGHYSPKL
jgi:hypothetical protein